MQTYPVFHAEELDVSRIAYGCMRLAATDQTGADAAIQAALDANINFFDHADIYGRGQSETLFGNFLARHSQLREHLVIQTKCGIGYADEPEAGLPKRYDLSYDHIMWSVEQSLERLQTDYLDILMLHRPDPLMNPIAVGQAFEELMHSGMVRHFAVSNFSAAQINLLQPFLPEHLLANQVELSLANLYLLDEGVMFNRADAASHLASGTLDFCRLNQIMIQAWSPLGGGKLVRGDLQNTPALQAVGGVLAQLAAKHDTTPDAIALAWLLHHPAGIQPIIGTIHPARIASAAAADDLVLTHGEWYALYIAARGSSMP